MADVRAGGPAGDRGADPDLRLHTPEAAPETPSPSGGDGYTITIYDSPADPVGHTYTIPYTANADSTQPPRDRG